jgi:hypothetical protein
MRALLRRGLVGVAVGLGTILASSGASAFCRTTTEPLPASYSPTRGCFNEGLFLYWRNACVGYSISSAASRNIPYEEAKRVIDASFQTWMNTSCGSGPPGITVVSQGAADCTEVRYNPKVGNQNLIVFRDDRWPYSDPNSTLGLTTVTFDATTGEIFDADMELNASGRNLSTTDAVPPNGFDLASVVTHEAGHFFGLAHATDSRSTMFASYKPGTIALRSLAPDDIAGLCSAYPNATTRVVTPTSTQARVIAAEACDASPRRGLLTECTETVEDKSCAMGRARSSPLPSLFFAAIVIVLRRRRASSRR